MVIQCNRNYRIKFTTPNMIKMADISGKQLIKFINKQLKHCSCFECSGYKMRFGLNTLIIELVG